MPRLPHLASWLCLSILGLARVTTSVSPQHQYLPPVISPTCIATSAVTVTERVTSIETRFITTTLSPSIDPSHMLGYLPPPLDFGGCPVTVTITPDELEGQYRSGGGNITPMPSLVTPFVPVSTQNIAGGQCRCDTCSYAIRTDPCVCVEEADCGEPLLIRGGYN